LPSQGLFVTSFRKHPWYYLSKVLLLGTETFVAMLRHDPLSKNDIKSAPLDILFFYLFYRFVFELGNFGIKQQLLQPVTCYQSMETLEQSGGNKICK